MVNQNIIHNRRKTAKLNACYFHLIRQQSVSLQLLYKRLRGTESKHHSISSFQRVNWYNSNVKLSTMKVKWLFLFTVDIRSEKIELQWFKKKNWINFINCDCASCDWSEVISNCYIIFHYFCVVFHRSLFA